MLCSLNHINKYGICDAMKLKPKVSSSKIASECFRRTNLWPRCPAMTLLHLPMRGGDDKSRCSHGNIFSHDHGVVGSEHPRLRLRRSRERTTHDGIALTLPQLQRSKALLPIQLSLSLPPQPIPDLLPLANEPASLT
jgi:hypothetical protein